MTTAINQLPDNHPDTKPEAATSELSRSTLTSLGKRARETGEETFAVPAVLKRVNRVAEESNLSEDFPQVTCDVLQLQDNNDVNIQKTKSAPTSFNGSKNLCPTLDINVHLPEGDVAADDEEEDEEAKKEKRLQQNRLSAKKCRQKKKFEQHSLSHEFQSLKSQNSELKEQISEITKKLLQVVEKNSALKSQIDASQQNQSQQLALQQLVYLLSQGLQTPQNTLTTESVKPQIIQPVPVRIPAQMQSAQSAFSAFKKPNGLLNLIATKPALNAPNKK